MLVVPATCPDCGTQTTVTRELPDDAALVTPNPCTGCGRPWSAVILQWRQANGKLVYQARLYPIPRRISQSRIGRMMLRR